MKIGGVTGAHVQWNSTPPSDSVPSMRTLERLAEATGSRLFIRFEPRGTKKIAR